MNLLRDPFARRYIRGMLSSRFMFTLFIMLDW